MHAEAVRYEAIPSKEGLIQDGSYSVTCAECSVKYHLHYDSEAEALATFCSILADEIVTARHPEHKSNVVLDLAALHSDRSRKPEVAWSVRTRLGVSTRNKRPNVP
jgi:hypothetical protein